MAVIGEIQKRPWLLLVVIFVGMLAFILGDSLSNNGGGAIEQEDIATVNGVGLSSADYQKLVDNEYIKYDSAYRILYRQSAPANLKQQLNETYINQYLSEQMLQAEYNKLGIKVNKTEFNELIQGKNIDGSVYESFGLFVGPDRKFSQDSLNKNIQNYLQNGSLNFIFNDMVGEQAKTSKKLKKYTTMISNGLYVTSHESKKAFEENSNAASFDYVYRSFQTVPATDLAISNEDLKAYYTKHKSEEKYEEKDKFSIQFAEFPINPSEDDLDFAKEFLEKRVKLFEDAENDTTFIVTNSDTRNFDFLKVVNYPAGIDTLLKSAEPGTVIGPYLDGDFFKLSKLISYEALEGEETKVLQVATIDSEIRRSKETINSVRDNALDFVNALDNSNVNDSTFVSIATKMNVNIIPKQEVSLAQTSINGFERGINTIKKWAFSTNTKEGDVSDDFVFDKKVVIAHLNSKSEEGTPAFENLSENSLAQIKAEVLKEKQAAYLISKMNGNNLEEIAKNAESTVQKAESVTLGNPTVSASPIPEPTVVGTAFGMAENTVSKTITGETGVFVVSLKSISKTEIPADLTANKQQLLNQLRQNVDNKAAAALRKKSNLEDNRNKVNILGN